MSKATESVLIISMFGALFHNIGQILVAYLYIQHHIFWYLLLLFPFAILAGFHRISFVSHYSLCKKFLVSLNRNYK